MHVARRPAALSAEAEHKISPLVAAPRRSLLLLPGMIDTNLAAVKVFARLEDRRFHLLGRVEGDETDALELLRLPVIQPARANDLTSPLEEFGNLGVVDRPREVAAEEFSTALRLGVDRLVRALRPAGRGGAAGRRRAGLTEVDANRPEMGGGKGG